VLSVLICSVGGAAALWLALGTVGRAGASELRLPMHPLRQGDVVNVAYVRRLRGDFRLKRIKARLVLERWDNGPHDGNSGGTRRSNYTWWECDAIDLGAGEAQLANGELVAVWRLEVPAPDLERERFGITWSGERPLRRVGGKHRWRFEVTYEIPGLPDDRSNFPLAIVRTRPMKWSLFSGWHD
jgi:hypothetical protein